MNFAQRARCAAAILFRAAADSVRFRGFDLVAFGCASPRTFAHRALCAAAIRALAAAESRPLPVCLECLEPLSAAKAASKCSTSFAARARFLLQLTDNLA